MGQRSQIYVRASGQLIVANYYQWNYAERMISRARYGIEYIDSVKDYSNWIFLRDVNVEHLRRILDVNFDLKDYQISSKIIEEWKDVFPDKPFNDVVFDWQDNNDGQLFIDFTKDGKISYAFRKTEDMACETPMSAAEYMEWDRRNWLDRESMTKAEKATCRRNIAAIDKMARLMTAEELKEFVHHDYGYKSVQEEN